MDGQRAYVSIFCLERVFCSSVAPISERSCWQSSHASLSGRSAGLIIVMAPHIAHRYFGRVEIDSHRLVLNNDMSLWGRRLNLPQRF